MLLLARPIGIEPTHLAPEASALSTELRAFIMCHKVNYISEYEKCQKTHAKKALLNTRSIFRVMLFWENKKKSVKLR